eukprot:909832-Amphidinium_carterae.3
MTVSRIASNRTTQRLEQVEASAREVEVLVSRERDELYEQLIQALGSHSNQVATPPPEATACGTCGRSDQDASPGVANPQQAPPRVLVFCCQQLIPRKPLGRLRMRLLTKASRYPTDIRASQGPLREKWIQASQKEIDTLISSHTISAITLQDRDALKQKCKKLGWQYSELPCKGVFTIKPDKYTARICGCGNFEQDTYGTTATNEMTHAS